MPENIITLDEFFREEEERKIREAGPTPAAKVLPMADESEEFDDDLGEEIEEDEEDGEEE